ncbi:hypothetical protein MMC25_006588 [Agyrium rufum]|nr:hypothetical protein [Agyrium rufum]
MNRPSRTDEPGERDGWNQSPRSLSGDLTTRSDMNGIFNLRMKRDHLLNDADKTLEAVRQTDSDEARSKLAVDGSDERLGGDVQVTSQRASSGRDEGKSAQECVVRSHGGDDGMGGVKGLETLTQRCWRITRKFIGFWGPGFMIAVAYIDPGNYSTDVAAGASKRFSLLFIVLMSNVFAVVLQTLSIRLGTITGMNLAEMCRAHLPRWLNLTLYILAEAAIVATDIAEVIGTAIALNLLLKIPLVWGCAISIVEVLFILLFYKDKSSLRRLRYFEMFIAALVLGVVVCFCIQLSLIENASIGEVFKGYLPSKNVVQGDGIYLSCGILGATVMVHSLYLGSGLPVTRLMAVDNALPGDSSSSQPDDPKVPYVPSLQAIKSCLNYSIIELVLSLTVFALFVNSAILITAGASLSNVNGAGDADIFAIHDLLSRMIAPIAGTVFALALLLSGTSAGIIATIAGQMVSEGALNWTMSPWMRRLLTRSISITPSIIIAGAVGRPGLSAALNGTQVALSVILPFTSAPLVYFTAKNKYMTVRDRNTASEDEVSQRRDSITDVVRDEEASPGNEGVKMRNHWLLSAVAIVIWGIITMMNVALLVLVGLGKA